MFYLTIIDKYLCYINKNICKSNKENQMANSSTRFDIQKIYFILSLGGANQDCQRQVQKQVKHIPCWKMRQNNFRIWNVTFILINNLNISGKI